MECICNGDPRNPFVLFIHGWPDDASLWDPLVADLSADYYCARVTLPGFDRKRPHEISPDFPELVEALYQQTQKLMTETSQKKVVLVGHDWGATLTYFFEAHHSELVQAMITMDVGADLKPKSLGHALFLVGYQWWLIAAYFLGKVLPPLGNGMSWIFAHPMGAPNTEGIRAKMNVLYFYFWRHLFTKKQAAFFLKRASTPAPLLYLYGGAKKYMFHSERWPKIVQKRPGSEVVNVPTAHHWLMLEEPTQTLQVMRRWLSSKVTKHVL